MGINPMLACVSAVSSRWTEHVGLPLGRVAKLLGASSPAHKADSLGRRLLLEQQQSVASVLILHSPGNLPF